MSKQEFIDSLRAALSGELNSALVADHIHYYEEYIQTEVRNGRSEQEVLGSLGDPRLIARTILATNSTEEAGAQSGGYREGAYQNGGHRDEPYRYGSGSSKVVRHSTVPGWVWALVVILIIVLILSIVMSVLSFLAPILIPVVVVVFLVKLFRDWLN